MNRSDIHLTPDQVHRLQGACRGVLEAGPWDRDKQRLALLIAATVHDALSGVPYHQAVPIVVDSPVSREESG